MTLTQTVQSNLAMIGFPSRPALAPLNATGQFAAALISANSLRELQRDVPLPHVGNAAPQPRTATYFSLNIGVVSAPQSSGLSGSSSSRANTKPKMRRNPKEPNRSF